MEGASIVFSLEERGFVLNVGQFSFLSSHTTADLPRRPPLEKIRRWLLEPGARVMSSFVSPISFVSQNLIVLLY